MRILLSLIMLISMSFGADTEGFRDFKWGSAPTKSMILDSKDIHTNSKDYRIKNDKLSIATARLNYISYSFHNNKFMSVMMGYKGLGNFQVLKETLESKYGSAYQPNQFIDDYYWFGGNSTIAISYSEIKDGGSIYMVNTAIKEEAEQYKSKIAAKGASDL